jgi:hypothetical protein
VPLDLYALLSDSFNNESDATGHAVSTVSDKSSDRVIRSAWPRPLHGGGFIKMQSFDT